MKINSEELLLDLKLRIKTNIERCEKIRTYSEQKLNQKQNLESWSALECIAHLNLYDDFYIPEISKRIAENKTTAQEIFKSAMLGNYFAQSMLPKKNGIQKMKTFKDKNPINSQLDISCIDKFIANQQIMLQLLAKSKHLNLQKVKTNISISTLIKLRLGDTLRFVIYHYQRHLDQAEKTLII